MNEQKNEDLTSLTTPMSLVARPRRETRDGLFHFIRGVLMEFRGFHRPESNWFRMPNEWIDLSVQMSGAEMRVVLYVLRHTWGFQEFDEFKKITLDEFSKGRKRADGTRIDAGTGLSLPSIRKGLKEAVDHGFLEVAIDDRDKGRIKRWFKLRMDKGHEGVRGKENHSQSTRKSHTGVKKLYPCIQETCSRTEKETLERNTKKKQSYHYDCDTSSGFGASLSVNDPKTTKEIEEIVKRLYEGLSKKRKIMRRANLKTWKKQVRTFLRETRVSTEEFSNLIEWYLDHIGGEFIPRAYSAKTFCDKFVRIQDARKRMDSREAEFSPPVVDTEMGDEAWERFCRDQDRKEIGVAE